jgi:hypothetical protein
VCRKGQKGKINCGKLERKEEGLDEEKEQRKKKKKQ